MPSLSAVGQIKDMAAHANGGRSQAILTCISMGLLAILAAKEIGLWPIPHERSWRDRVQQRGSERSR
jgi:hypothetical protein